jgi:hypothetical protein
MSLKILILCVIFIFFNSCALASQFFFLERERKKEGEREGGACVQQSQNV